MVTIAMHNSGLIVFLKRFGDIAQTMITRISTRIPIHKKKSVKPISKVSRMS